MSGGLEALLDGSLTDAADALASGEVTRLALARTALDRLSRAGRDLNCLIRLDEDEALARAAALDERSDSANLPLAGVPLAHKDMFYRAGRRSTCGTTILRERRTTGTSPLLQRLDQGGQIDLGTLHMAEFAMSPMGSNAHLGPCRNPWDPSRVSGGSSSGSAAAVAAGAIFGALGSDTGGSVRLPAAVCGIVGLKPTQGLLPLREAMPLSGSLDCAGVLARTARDCARLLDVLSGTDGACERALDARIDPVTVAIPDLEAEAPMTEGVRQAFAEAARVLRGAGVRVVEVPMPAFDDLASCANVVLGAEAATLHAAWLRTRAQDYGRQVRRRIERGLLVPATSYLDALRLRRPMLREFLDRFLPEGAVALALPTMPEPAPTIAEANGPDEDANERRFASFSYWTRAINYLGCPAISTPMGFEGGLPVGLQLVGRPFGEAPLLRVAERYAAIAGWPRVARAGAAPVTTVP